MSRADHLSRHGVRGYTSMTDITRELDYGEETAYWIARHIF